MTLYQKFQETVAKFHHNEFLAELKNDHYHKYTYGEIANKVASLASGLVSIGCVAGDHVALMLPNGSDWVVTDLACAKLGLVVVPVHTTYHFQYLAYIVQQAECNILVIDSELFEKYQEQIIELNLPRLIIRGPYNGTKFYSFEKLLLDSKEPVKIQKSADALHTIIYTSGTTAEPKGVMLSHKNILINVEYASHYIPLVEEDRFFSFLPLSHVLERSGGYYAPMSFGAAIYFASDPQRIAEQLPLARPTVMLAVPRIFEKLYQKTQDTIELGPKWKKKLFYKALALKNNRKQPFYESWQRAILQRVVLNKILSKLGGRLRFVVSGGAALDPHIAEFFHRVGLLVLEGYGLTETSPIIAVNSLSDYRFGTVGKPLENVTVKIGPDKEILMRGDSLMKGYYNKPEVTAQAIDVEGWFHTGDMGIIDNDGFLSIVGRLKELIILSTGKNVNPVPIEQALNLSKYINQSMVYGDGQKHLSVIIVPDFKELDLWMNENEIQKSDKFLDNNVKIRQLYADQLATCLKDFNHIEQIKEFKLITEEFTISNDLLTPSLKLRRNKIISKYIK